MSPAKHFKDLRQEDFDRLLDWLAGDREAAGVIYEKIRWRLVAILAARGCLVPEERRSLPGGKRCTHRRDGPRDW